MKEIYLKKNEYNRFVNELDNSAEDITFYTDDPIYFISKLSSSFEIDQEGEVVSLQYKKYFIEAHEDKIIARYQGGKRVKAKTTPGEGGENLQPVLTIREM